MKNTVLALINALPKQFPGLLALDTNIVYLMGCMKLDQFCCTWRALENPMLFCPFCPAELNRRGRKPITSTHGWSIFANEFPRSDTERMLLIIPDHHIVRQGRATIHDFTKMGFLFQDVVDSLIPDGVLVMRFGNPLYHAGTIPHLHANIIRPTPEGGCSLPIAKHVSGPYGHMADYARLHDFVAQIEERGGMEWLFSTEGIVETQPPIVV